MTSHSSLEQGFDQHKPSNFGKNILKALGQLSSLIPPSLRYILAVATHRRPRYLLNALNSFDELFALLMLVVERHFLKTYGGSFTENFYGLKRERVLRIKDGEALRAGLGAPHLMRETLRLKDRDIWKNLAVLVGLPYVRRKLDESYEIHAPQTAVLGYNYNRDMLPHDATLRQRIMYYYKQFLRNIYPSVNAAYYFSLFAFNLAYLSDNTKYSSPFLWLIGTRIRRMGEADYRAIALAETASVPPPHQRGRRWGHSASIWNPATFSAIYSRLLPALKLLLPTSIFALKFLEWWYASDFARQLSRKATEGLDLPPPLVTGLPAPRPAPSTNPLKNSQTNPTARSNNTVSLSSPPPSAAAIAAPGSPRPLSTPAAKPTPPISSASHLPIFTVLPPSTQTSALCPICLHAVQTPTSAQTGYVFCYTCIFKWVEGSHERQVAFMAAGSGEEGWGDESDDEAAAGLQGGGGQGGGREGKWESGKGRCAVTGRRVLGGTEGLRRLMI
ncbi:MAG: hypothetical protein LQ351_007323 [Letrouitia transgressa]|nr:MAG: hypothetical protein LQ351_007323 [Letrouitia transgressa]